MQIARQYHQSTKNHKVKFHTYLSAISINFLQWIKYHSDVHQSSNKEDNFIENPNGILDEIASLSSHKSKPDLTTIIENLKMKAQLRENSKIGKDFIAHTLYNS